MNFKSSAIFSIFASFGLLIFNMLINVIESRVLGPKDIGRYQVFITSQTLFATFCALGLGQACIYFINALKYNERTVLSTTINATLPLSFLAGILFFVSILLFPNYFGIVSWCCIMIFCFGTTSILLSNILTPVLLAKMEVVKHQIVKYSSSVLTLLLLSLALILWRKFDIEYLLIVTGVANILSLLLLYVFLCKRFSFYDGVDWSLLKKIVIWGLKLAGNNIATLILASIPIYFLSWFSSQSGFVNVGYYSRANSLLIVGTVICTSIGPLLYSRWSLINKDELKSHVRKLSIILTLINIIIALGLIIGAPLIIRILYGEAFGDVVPILQILAISLVPNSQKEICYGILSSQGAPLLILKNLIIGILLSVLLNYFVIPLGGAQGAASVTVIVIYITTLLLKIDVSRYVNLKISDFCYVPILKDLHSILKNR